MNAPPRVTVYTSTTGSSFHTNRGCGYYQRAENTKLREVHRDDYLDAIEQGNGIEVPSPEETGLMWTLYPCDHCGRDLYDELVGEDGRE